MIAILSGTSGWHDPEVDELFSGMPNAFGIADEILIAGFVEQGRD